MQRASSAGQLGRMYYQFTAISTSHQEKIAAVLTGVDANQFRWLNYNRRNRYTLSLIKIIVSIAKEVALAFIRRLPQSWKTLEYESHRL